MRKLITPILATLALSSCSNALPDWLGTKDEKKPLEGERISILSQQSNLSASAKTMSQMRLPAATLNEHWPHQDARPAPHVKTAENVKLFNRVDLGSEPLENFRLTSNPVIFQGKLYALDGEGLVTARSTQNLGSSLWTYRVDTGTTYSSNWVFDGTATKDFIGGNIAYDKAMLFITTAYGDMIALDSKTGQELWKRNVRLPIKSAPISDGELVYATTSTNRLYAIDIKNGATRWVYDALDEKTSIFGSTTPVLFGDKVAVAFSSGELVVFERKTGKPVWKDVMVNPSASRSSLVAINDIDATPIYHENVLYAVSNDGVLNAYEASTGRKMWTQAIESVQTPWLAGDYLFIITSNDELVAINLYDGAIRWVTQLPSYTEVTFDWDGENKGEPLEWFGPVLTGRSLYVVGSNGLLLRVAPFGGEIVSQTTVSGPVFLPPIVAENNMYIMNNSGTLNVLK